MAELVDGNLKSTLTLMNGMRKHYDVSNTTKKNRKKTLSKCIIFFVSFEVFYFFLVMSILQYILYFSLILLPVTWQMVPLARADRFLMA